ncbi:MAG: LysR family transcriptional regulator [Lachnospiraceae bacterium]|nr:LysR family transcriptional regulator [Lachnospiraceae bacterium]
MEIKQLEFLIAAAESGSLNKASEQLYTTQSNVSKIIKKLEDELGYKLFIRKGKGVYLTPEGEKAYRFAKEIINKARHITQISVSNDRQTFRVIMSPSVELEDMIFRFFGNEYPSHVSVREGNIHCVIDAVESSRAQFGLIFVSEKQKPILQHLLRRRMLVLKPLTSARLVISVNRNAVLNVERLTNNTADRVRFIRCQDDFDTPENQLKQTLESENWIGGIHHALELDHIGSVRRALETTEMVYLNFCLKKSFPDKTIVDVPIDSEDGNIYLCMVYNQNTYMSELQKKFIHFIQNIPTEEENPHSDFSKT